jgi:hypothetical protein
MVRQRMAFLIRATEARVFMFERGSPGVSMLRTNYDQLRAAMIDGHYITPRQFDGEYLV